MSSSQRKNQNFGPQVAEKVFYWALVTLRKFVYFGFAVTLYSPFYLWFQGLGLMSLEFEIIHDILFPLIISTSKISTFPKISTPFLRKCAYFGKGGGFRTNKLPVFFHHRYFKQGWDKHTHWGCINWNSLFRDSRCVNLKRSSVKFFFLREFFIFVQSLNNELEREILQFQEEWHFPKISTRFWPHENVLIMSGHSIE